MVLAKQTNGTFTPNTIEIFPAGDELVVMLNKNTMTLEGQSIEVDMVLVWRIVDGRVTEVWDIPSVYSGRVSEV